MFASGIGHSLSHGWVAELSVTNPIGVRSAASKPTVFVEQTGSLNAAGNVDLAGGLSITHGLMTTAGLQASGGIRSTAAVTIAHRGLHVDAGVLKVSHDGVHAVANVVVQAGASVMGGSLIRDGIAVHGGTFQSKFDMVVSGGVVVRGDKSGTGLTSVSNGMVAVLGNFSCTGGGKIYGGMTVHDRISLLSTIYGQKHDLRVLGGAIGIGRTADGFLFDASSSNDSRTVLALSKNSGTHGAYIGGDGKMTVSRGGATINGRMTIATGGASVSSDGVTIVAGGLGISGGTIVKGDGVLINSAGMEVNGSGIIHGGLQVSDTGVRIIAGGMTITENTCAVTGGVAVSCGVVNVESGHVNITGGAQLFQGRFVVGNGVSLTSGDLLVTSSDNTTGLSSVGGAAIHGSDGATIMDSGVLVGGRTVLRKGTQIDGNVQMVDDGLYINGNVDVWAGGFGLGYMDTHIMLAARGQSSMGPVTASYIPAGRTVSFTGFYTGNLYPARIVVRIDGVAGPGSATDTFAWTKCQLNGTTCVRNTDISASQVPIALNGSLPANQYLIEGVHIRFSHATGHMANTDPPGTWSVDIAATNMLALRNANADIQISVGQNGVLDVKGGMSVATGTISRKVQVHSGAVLVKKGAAHIAGGINVTNSNGVNVRQGGMQTQGNFSVSSALQVRDTGSTIAGGWDIQAAAQISGGLLVRDGAHITGGLRLAGNSLIHGHNLYHNGLASSGGAEFRQGSVVKGKLSIARGLTISSANSARGFHIMGGAAINGGASVYGRSIVSGAVVISNAADVMGSITLKGGMNASGGFRSAGMLSLIGQRSGARVSAGLKITEKMQVMKGLLAVNGKAGATVYGGFQVLNTGVFVGTGGVRSIGGANVSGGSRVTGGIVVHAQVGVNGGTITAGGMHVQGGLLANHNLEVESSGMRITGGHLTIKRGLQVQQGMVITAHGMAQSDGLAVDEGGISVHAGGINIKAGGLSVATNRSISMVDVGVSATHGIFGARNADGNQLLSINASGHVRAKGGARIGGGLRVSNQLIAKNGVTGRDGIRARGGVFVTDAVHIHTGTVAVMSDNVTVADTLRALAGGMTVSRGTVSIAGTGTKTTTIAGGLKTPHGGIVVNNGGAALKSGAVSTAGVYVQQSDFVVDGGPSVFASSVTIDAVKVGLTVKAGGVRASHGFTISGGVAIANGVASAAGVQIQAISHADAKDQLLINGPAVAAMPNSEAYVARWFSLDGVFNRTFAAYASPGDLKFSIDNNGSMSGSEAFYVDGDITMGKGADVVGKVRVRNGTRVSGASTISGGANITQGMLISGGIQLGQDHLVVTGSARLHSGARIRRGVHSVGGLRVNAGGVNVSLDGLMFSGGNVTVVGGVDALSRFNFGGGGMISSGLALSSGDYTVNAGGFSIKCGHGIVNSTILVSQGATTGKAVHLRGGLRAMQGANVAGGVKVTDVGLSVTNQMHVVGGTQIRGGLISLDDVIVSGQLAVSNAGTHVGNGLQSETTIRVIGSATLNGTLLLDKMLVSNKGITTGSITVNGINPSALMEATGAPRLRSLTFAGSGLGKLTVNGTYTQESSRAFILTIINVTHYFLQQCFSTMPVCTDLNAVSRSGTFSADSPILLYEGLRAFVHKGYAINDTWSFLFSTPKLFATANAAGDELLRVSESGAVNVSRGGATIDGRMTIATGGASVSSDGVTIVAGGLGISGGTIVKGDGVLINSAGMEVNGSGIIHGGLQVSDTGVRITAGGLKVQLQGLKVDGGIVTRGQGIVKSGGAIVNNGVRVVQGDTTMLGGLLNISSAAYLAKGLVIADTGLKVLAGGVTLSDALHVRYGGVQILSGGLDIQSAGLSMIGQLKVDQLKVAQGRLVVQANGASVQGPVVVGHGASVFGGLHLQTGVALTSGKLLLQQGTMNVQGRYNVAHGTVVKAGIHVGNGLGVSKHISISGVAHVDGDISVTAGHVNIIAGNIDVMQRLDVGGGTTIDKALTVKSGLSSLVDGLVASGGVNVSSGGLSSRGDIVVHGNRHIRIGSVSAVEQLQIQALTSSDAISIHPARGASATLTVAQNGSWLVEGGATLEGKAMAGSLTTTNGQLAVRAVVNKTLGNSLVVADQVAVTAIAVNISSRTSSAIASKQKQLGNITTGGRSRLAAGKTVSVQTSTGNAALRARPGSLDMAVTGHCRNTLCNGPMLKITSKTPTSATGGVITIGSSKTDRVLVTSARKPLTLSTTSTA
eukprot:SAG25_NODE_297_length_10202_cov_39.630110_2_plen_2229_part_01